VTGPDRDTHGHACPDARAAAVLERVLIGGSCTIIIVGLAVWAFAIATG
jgi:hypothetical protein